MNIKNYINMLVLTKIYHRKYEDKKIEVAG
jgi:hypothetical protein